MNKSIPIKDLLNNISKGDNDSFRIFYDRFFQKALQLSHYFIRSDEICEEIVSDVFISIWLNKEKLPEIENINAYLFIITKNRALNFIDKQARIPTMVADIPGGICVDSSNPENIFITKELESIIQNSIDQLPEKCRIIFQMSREEKLKHQQIAEILSISENTVHAQIVIALSKLHELLKKFIYMIF